MWFHRGTWQIWTINDVYIIANWTNINIYYVFLHKLIWLYWFKSLIMWWVHQTKEHWMCNKNINTTQGLRPPNRILFRCSTSVRSSSISQSLNRVFSPFFHFQGLLYKAAIVIDWLTWTLLGQIWDDLGRSVRLVHDRIR